MLIDAQFFPLHTQEHCCKKESWHPKKYFPVAFPKSRLRPHHPFWIPKCATVMVPLVLPTWSLHMRRIYLQGGVKQYEQTMKSLVVKCVKSSIYYYFLWCCFQLFFTACKLQLMDLEQRVPLIAALHQQVWAAASSQIVAVSKQHLCIQGWSCRESSLVGNLICLIVWLLTGQQAAHPVVPSKNNLS